MPNAGVDVGFGFTKAAVPGSETKTFRSVVGDFSPITFNVANNSSEQLAHLAIEYKGAKYFVGDEAVKQSRGRQTIDKSRTVTGEGVLLLVTALSLLTDKPAEDFKLVLGLPVLHFDSLKAEYTEAVIGQHTTALMHPNGDIVKRTELKVTDARVIPQPAGALFDWILDKDGQVTSALAAKRVGIVDIGYNTTDLVVFDNLDYITKRAMSYSNMGVSTVHQQLVLELFRKYEVEVSSEQVDFILERGSISVGGREFPIKEQEESVCASVAESVLSKIKNTWPDAWQLDAIIFTGGGAAILQDWLVPAFPQAKLPEDPMNANVRGFLKYASRVWK